MITKEKGTKILGMCADNRVKDSYISHITEWLNIELDAEFSPQGVRAFLKRHNIPFKKGLNVKTNEPNTLIKRKNYISQKWDKDFVL